MENYRVNSKLQHEERSQHSSLSINFSQVFNNINISNRVLFQMLNRNRVYLSAYGFGLNNKHLKTICIIILKLIMLFKFYWMLAWVFQEVINVAIRRLNNSDLDIRKPKF